MEKGRFGIAFAALVLATTSARAVRPTMPDAIKVTLARSPTLAKVTATRAQLVGVVGQGKTSLKPRVSATGTFRFDYVDPLDVTKKDPGFDPASSYNGSLTATQLITDWG